MAETFDYRSASALIENYRRMLHCDCLYHHIRDGVRNNHFCRETECLVDRYDGETVADGLQMMQAMMKRISDLERQNKKLIKALHWWQRK